MNRIEIEVKLNNDRAWLLDVYARLPPDDLLRGATRSEHDASAMWSAKDHLAHLAGIEIEFQQMIRKHVGGDPSPVGVRRNLDGSERTREEILAAVHEMTERWVVKHRAMPLSGIVALGQSVRAGTLALLAELSDEQLGEKLPGALWADGTVGALIVLQDDHGRLHWQWAKEGLGLADA